MWPFGFGENKTRFEGCWVAPPLVSAFATRTGVNVHRECLPMVSCLCPVRFSLLRQGLPRLRSGGDPVRLLLLLLLLLRLYGCWGI